MLQQFTNLSTWREDKITVEAGEVYTLKFMDTRPNMFYIQNPNSVKLRVSMGSIPTHENYEFKIDENTTATLGRPIQTGYLYILNDGVESAGVTVYSVAKEFDMNVLKNISLVAEGVTLDTDGIVRGFADGISIPSGSNHIGKVSISSDSSGTLATVSKQNDIMGLMESLLHNGDADGSIVSQIGYVLNKLSELNINLTQFMTAYSGNSDYLILLDILRSMGHHEQDVFTYLNNVTNLSLGAYDSAMFVKFDWLYNDGGLATINLYNANGVATDLLSLFTGEKLENVEFYIPKGSRLTVESETPMYRIRYWLRGV